MGSSAGCPVHEGTDRVVEPEIVSQCSLTNNGILVHGRTSFSGLSLNQVEGIRRAEFEKGALNFLNILSDESLMNGLTFPSHEEHDVSLNEGAQN